MLLIDKFDSIRQPFLTPDKEKMRDNMTIEIESERLYRPRKII